MMKLRVFILLSLLLAFSQLSCGRKGGDAESGKPLVVILGMDGADWSLIDPLIAQGRLPLFKELKEKHAWGSLQTVTPAKSPVVWTSIASGKTQRKHGIEDFRSTRVNARGKHPICSSLDVREPLLWEMLGQQGLRSVLVNWYLSYPPQPLNGVDVSDYFAASALSSSASREEMMRRAVYPPERAPELGRLVERDYRRVLEKMGLPDFPALYGKLGTGLSSTDFPVFGKFPEKVLQEGAVADMAARLYRSETYDLFAVYFELADMVQHFAFMCFLDDAAKKALDRSVKDGKPAEALAGEAYAKIADILCPVYQNLERILREFFARADRRETYFIIVSDHGFSFFFREGTVRYNHIGPEKAPDGILIVRGPGVRPGKVRLARIYDIAPTVLYILGLPLDRGMDGQPLRRLFSFKRASRYTVYTKKKPRATAGNEEVDEKKLQQLKALGYIN